MPGVDQLQPRSWNVLSPLPRSSIPLHPGIGKKEKEGRGGKKGGEREEREGKRGKERRGVREVRIR